MLTLVNIISVSSNMFYKIFKIVHSPEIVNTHKMYLLNVDFIVITTLNVNLYFIQFKLYYDTLL